MSIRRTLHPERYAYGSNGGYGYGHDRDDNFDLENILFSRRNVTVREVLNEIVKQNGNALWLVEFVPSKMMKDEPFFVQRSYGADVETDFTWRMIPLREKSDRGFHIIPVAVRGVSGKQVSDRSPLNIVIALPIKVRTALQELEEICAATGQLTHRRLVVGTIPIGMFSKSLGKRRGSRIIARRALDDLLEKTGNGVKLSWRLLYGPDTRMYALNIHAVP